MKKERILAIGVMASLLLGHASAIAEFKHWESQAFQPGNVEKQAQKQQKEERHQQLKEGEEQYWEHSKLHYYEEVTPKDIERQHDYLMEDHPLQEEPLPDKIVE